ncbi:MAG: hypothetical protein ACE5DI_02410 [Candidatus Micrarchaeia archaeon]
MQEKALKGAFSSSGGKAVLANALWSSRFTVVQGLDGCNVRSMNFSAQEREFILKGADNNLPLLLFEDLVNLPSALFFLKMNGFSKVFFFSSSISSGGEIVYGQSMWKRPCDPHNVPSMGVNTAVDFLEKCGLKHAIIVGWNDRNEAFVSAINDRINIVEKIRT